MDSSFGLGSYSGRTCGTNRHQGEGPFRSSSLAGTDGRNTRSGARATRCNVSEEQDVCAAPASGASRDNGRFPNLDPIFHNAFSSFDGKVFDVGLYPPGKSRSVRFDRAGIVRVFCNIHPAMSAVIVVVNWPWFADSARDGSFQIQSVPEGNYTLHVYHERATDTTLAALTREVSVKQEPILIKPITISETGYLPAQHKNKYGKDYPHAIIYSEHMP